MSSSYHNAFNCLDPKQVFRVWYSTSRYFHVSVNDWLWFHGPHLFCVLPLWPRIAATSAAQLARRGCGAQSERPLRARCVYETEKVARSSLSTARSGKWGPPEMRSTCLRFKRTEVYPCWLLGPDVFPRNMKILILRYTIYTSHLGLPKAGREMSKMRNMSKTMFKLFMWF